MKKAALLIVGGAGLAYLLAKGYNTLQAANRLQYLNPRIKLGKIGLTRVELQMTIDLQNTGSADIPLQYFTGNINYIFGTPATPNKLSSFTFNPGATNATSIKARSITTVPFTVVISNLSAISTIVKIVKSLTSGDKLSTLIQVDGAMYAAGVDIPVKFTYDIKNNAVAGIGSTESNNVILTTYSNVDRLFYCYVAPSKDSDRSKWIEIGYSQTKPTPHQLFKMLKNSATVTGIGSVKASLEFSSNSELEKYFSGKRAEKKLLFSKN